MTAILIETDSRVADPNLRIDTRKLEFEDWFFPETVTGVSDTTDVESEKNDSISTKRVSSSQSRPLRRSSYGVHLDGNRVKMLQQWECVITQVCDNLVCCEMHDLTEESNPSEYAEIYLSEFNEFDLPLLSEGTVFYWSIGHTRRTSGTIIRTSELRVRRLPKISKVQKADISRKVKQLSELIVKD